MPRRRYISTNISTDCGTNKLSTFAALLYTWAIPHFNDDCRLTPKNAEEIKWSVIPARSEGIGMVVSAIEEIVMAGLWGMDNNGHICMPSESFYKYQTYIPAEKRRETPQIAASPAPSPSPSPSPKEEQERPKGAAVDNSKNEGKKEVFKRDVESMWKRVIQMTKIDPGRFDKKLASWAGKLIQKGWQPKDIQETLEEFVRFEDGNSRVQEWFPYLNRILQARKTREHQAESAKHKEYDPSSVGGILKQMKGKA